MKVILVNFLDLLMEFFGSLKIREYFEDDRNFMVDYVGNKIREFICD